MVNSRDEAVVAAVLRHEPDAGVEHLLTLRPTSALPSSGDRAGDARLQAEDRLGELGLAVALHAGDREDLARAHLEARRRRRRAGRGRR